MTYAEKLQDPRWQKKRLEILERDKFKCQLCLDTNTTLHIHHKKYNGSPWESPNEDLITYCKHCHLFIEENNSESELVRTTKTILKNGDVILYAIFFVDSDKEYFTDVYYIKKGNELSYWYTLWLDIAEVLIRMANKHKNG